MNIIEKLILTAMPKFKGFGSSFSWDNFYANVVSFVEKYVFAAFGVIGFLVFVSAGLLIATSGFAQREDDQYHKAKKMALSFVLGTTVSLSAGSIVLMLSTMFR